MINETDLLRLRSGDMTFDTFAGRTRPDFIRIARKLALTLPTWMDVEDLAHEMMMSVPAALRVWRPGEYRLKAFIVFRACARARKVAARARQRVAREVDLDSDSAPLPEALVRPAEQQDRLELGEHLAQLELELPQTGMQLAVLRSLARTQSMDATALELILHPDTRVMFAADPDLVRSKIRRVMTVLAARAK